MERCWHLRMIFFYWLRGGTYHSLDVYQNCQCFLGIWFSRCVWPETDLRYPINSRNQKSPSITAELKHTLVHKCTTFSASRLLHRFLVSARTGFTRYQKTLTKIVGSDCTAQYIDGLMKSFFLPEALPYLESMTWRRKSVPYIITLPKYTSLIIFVGSVRYL